MSQVDSNNRRIEALRQRWEQDAGSRLYLQLADEYRKQGQLEEAAEVLGQGLERRPGDLSGQVALGRCRLDLGQLEEAIEQLEAVVARDTAHLVANKLLVEAHLQQGDGPRAGERLELYRLLNDRDPELEHLEYRLQQLREPQRGADQVPAEDEPVLDVDPGPSADAPTEDVAASPSPDAEESAESEAVGGADAGEGVEAEEPSAPRAAGDVFALTPEPAPALAWDELWKSADPRPEEQPFGDLASPRAEMQGGAPPLAPGDVFTPTEGAETPPVADVELPEEPLAAETEVDEETDIAPATVTLGELYLEQGHHSEAEEIFRRVLEEDPGNERATAGLAKIDPSAPDAAPAEPEPAASELEPAAEPDLPPAEPEPLAADPVPVVVEAEAPAAEAEPPATEPEPVLVEAEPPAAEPEPAVAELEAAPSVDDAAAVSASEAVLTSEDLLAEHSGADGVTGLTAKKRLVLQSYLARLLSWRRRARNEAGETG